jgi:hypothetical protein
MSLILPTQGPIKGRLDRLIGPGLDCRGSTDTAPSCAPLEDLAQTTIMVVCRLLRARLRSYLYARAGALARERGDPSQAGMYELLVEAAEGFEFDAHASWCATRRLWVGSTVDNPRLWLRWCMHHGLARVRRVDPAPLVSALPPEHVEGWIREFMEQLAVDPDAL